MKMVALGTEKVGKTLGIMGIGAGGPEWVVDLLMGPQNGKKL